jgi:hypothetical protein
MGGIDQTLFGRLTVSGLRAHVREGIQLGGERRFLLAGGCSIGTDVATDLVTAAVEEARRTR